MGLGLVGVVFATAIAITVVKACMDVDDHKAAFGDLMSDPLWFDDGVQVTFFGADKVPPTRQAAETL